MDYKRRTYYLLFTACFFILWFLFKLGGIPDFKKAIASTTVDIAFCMATLLVTVEYLLPKYMYQNKYPVFFFFFCVVVVTAGSAIILLQLALMGSSLFSYRQMVIKYQNHFLYWFWSDLIIGSYLLVALIAMAGATIRLAFDRILAAQRVEILEKEKISAELSTLKDQLNPHFLFNALNTVYYQIEKSNLVARNTLEQVSSLLRYQLYECDHEEVPIEREIEFLSNYIQIQSKRFSGKCQVNCPSFENIKEFSIAPFLLAPLIENCFKHVSHHDMPNNFIDIKCAYEDNWFSLETVNSTSKTGNQLNTGIGLNNVRKRLKLTYLENRYSLQTETTDQVFRMTLKLHTK